jgi:hypothetical protein
MSSVEWREAVRVFAKSCIRCAVTWYLPATVTTVEATPRGARVSSSKRSPRNSSVVIPQSSSVTSATVISGGHTSSHAISTCPPKTCPNENLGLSGSTDVDALDTNAVLCKGDLRAVFGI